MTAAVMGKAMEIRARAVATAMVLGLQLTHLASGIHTCSTICLTGPVCYMMLHVIRFISLYRRILHKNLLRQDAKVTRTSPDTVKRRIA
jgi:hypothetical protein